MASRNRNDAISSRNLILDEDIVLKENIHIFLDIITEEKTSDSFRLILWLGEEDDGMGKRIELTELFSVDHLEKLPRRLLNLYLPDLLRGDWKEFVEKKLEKILLPRLHLDISVPINAPNRDLIHFEMGVDNSDYLGAVEVPIQDLTEVLEVSEE